jgi:hypothetical protein
MIENRTRKLRKQRKSRKYGGSSSPEISRIISAEKKVKLAELELEALKQKKIIALHEKIKQSRKMIDFLRSKQMLPSINSPIPLPKPPPLTRYNNPQTPATPLIRRKYVNQSRYHMAKR